MYSLHVEGMSCNHCISKVTRSVKKVDDTAKVDVNLATKKVSVDSKADLDDIVHVISEAGYAVEYSN